MPPQSTIADRLLEGDRTAAAQLAGRLLKPQRDNLVERPWGGDRLRAFKNLAVPTADPEAPFGESFEISADDGDDEARLHPSRLELADGSTITLPALLAVHADTLLGPAFVARHGRRFPLLPKLLDIAELLSVQAHPPGNTEVYVVIDADPGATIRLGFTADVDAGAWLTKLASARQDQQQLLDLTRAERAGELQALLKPWLASREASPDELEAAFATKLSNAGTWAQAKRRLAALHATYWDVLDSMNTIRVEAGDVIHNATPARIAAATGKPPSAEVHALGNPEGLGVFALEIRRPGPTFRAWDNVRFPLRRLDIEAAVEALNLQATRPDEFAVAPALVRRGVRRSVDSEHFRLEHLEPGPGFVVDVPAAAPHSLHALAGRASVQHAGGGELGTLERGESAFVPLAVGAYRVVAEDAPATVLKVTLPPYDE